MHKHRSGRKWEEIIEIITEIDKFVNQYKSIMKKNLLSLLLIINIAQLNSQIKILFSAKKGEQAGNADWVIDTDSNAVWVTTSGTYTYTGNESNPQRFPSPAQSGVTASTLENYWKGGISSYAIECVKLGYSVESHGTLGRISYNDPTNPQDLKNYRLFVVCEPNIRFTMTEKAAIINYVSNGGRLLMVADHETSDRNNDGWESRTIWNDLMTNNGVNNNSPFGIFFDSVDIFQTSTNYTSNSNDSILNSSQFGSVTQMKFANGTTMTLDPSKNATVKGEFFSTGASKTTTKAWVAIARYGSGKVAGFGDSSPFDDGTGDINDNLYDGWITDASGNHRKIIMNTTLWLVALDSFKASITSSKDTICNGDSILFTANLGSSYLWSTGATTQSIYAKSQGSYSVTVTNSLGQQSLSTKYLYITTIPTPTISSTSTMIQTQNIFTTYQWYNNTNLISSATNYQYFPIQSGNYNVKVTLKGCISESNVFAYAMPNPFVPKIQKSADSLCAGDSVILTSSLGTNYSWSNGNTSQSIIVKTSGKYIVTVDSNSSQGKDSTNIFFRPLPSPSITKTGLYLATSNSYSAYQWYRANIAISGETTYFTTPMSTGNYSVKVSDKYGCSGVSKYYLITDNLIDTKKNITYTYDLLSKSFQFSSDKPNLSLFIYNNNGMIVEKYNINYEFNLNMSAYPKGLYLIKINCQNDEFETIKFINE